LPSESEVDSYIDSTVAPMFRLHPDLQAKVGKGRSDDKRTFKKISGRKLEYLPVNKKTITGRQGSFIVGDEIDAITPRLRGTFASQVKIRGRTLGTRRKAYLCSHPDAGWTSGIGAAYRETTRGIWYWPCPHCASWSSPCPPAPHRMVLDYERPANVSDDDYLERVAETACLICPHCGGTINDADKVEMLLGGKWVFEGQEIAEDGTITGEPRSMTSLGFWIHGTMSPFVKFGELARDFEAAQREFYRTRKPERLREVTSKVLGEVYEGGSGAGGALEPRKLERRAATDGFPLGAAPGEVMFVTAAVDVGGSKFDVSFYGWDLEGRSWLIDRITIKQRLWADGVTRDLRTAERIEDWMVLEDQVLNRLIPLVDEPGMALPVAGMAVDTGDGNVTWKAREFARRMAARGHCWGSGTTRWERVRLIKGATRATATELPAKGRTVSVDEQGKPVTPVVLEWDLGVHKLKTLSVERLAVTDGQPGQCYFATGLPQSTFAEFTGEVLIDGKWERRGPNESLDLFGYAEAVRLMLRPDRADIKWDVRRPIWARPVPIERAADAPISAPVIQRTAPTPKPAKTIFERFDQLNRDEER
ncbi:terminase gpA endonuclease subunit, partial [Sphingomonas sp.]|uniref:terminase gpA endonuclease subunit n=1 Tax=Sphingomonas sp. TaxID=28214 RepID=UPI0035A9268C